MSDSLTLNQYQAEAMSFRLGSANEAYVLAGLVGEVGELYSLVAKALRDGKKPEFDLQYKKEIGDILWFVAALAMDAGYTLEDIAENNINKLAKRKEAGTIQGSGDNR